MDVDLFGDPVRLANGRRGRPAHRYDQKTANKIMMLLAMGWAQERIANACHISVPTLRKHYFSILKTRDIQRDRLVAWQFEKLAEQADKGNVGAMRELNRMIDRNDDLVAEAKLRAKGPAETAAPPKGKKELSAEAAQRAEQELEAQLKLGDHGPH